MEYFFQIFPKLIEFRKPCIKFQSVVEKKVISNVIALGVEICKMDLYRALLLLNTFTWHFWTHLHFPILGALLNPKLILILLKLFLKPFIWKYVWSSRFDISICIAGIQTMPFHHISDYQSCTAWNARATMNQNVGWFGPSDEKLNCLKMGHYWLFWGVSQVQIEVTNLILRFFKELFALISSYYNTIYLHFPQIINVSCGALRS